MGDVFRRCAVATVVGALSCSMAFAQNLVGNGDFDLNVAGWIVYGAEVVLEWDGDDYQQSLMSGSARITNGNSAPMYSGTVACVDGIVGGGSYDLGGRVRVAGAQSAEGTAGLGVNWRTGASCTGSQTTAGTTPLVVSSDAWVLLTKFGQVAPLGTQSAEVVLLNNKTSDGVGEYRAFYDGVFLGAFGGIFADGFESGNATEWSVVEP